ncbi:PAS domain-containing protein [Salinarimonas soli]|uniref:PAS domain-containing protein n=1 Tax=Salinarimonas soli TaxID=1638099 RepID=A0A5B2VT77_9HYPH|nr:PAS domain-containing protein [Salinarimonas soli]KAA2242215.1 PAS domain-containing protein [Salinarimonas soli]
MTVEDLIRTLAEANDTAIVLTDTSLGEPGPTILYVNPAFCRMTGYEAHEVVGRSPRMLQGARTNRLVLRTLARALREGKPFSGCVVNYRKSGEQYLCQVDIEPLFNRAGELEHFIAFEREVKRRRGRPAKGALGRFEAVSNRQPAPKTNPSPA